MDWRICVRSQVRYNPLVNDAEMDRILVETLEDRRLSRAERRAFKQVVAE